MLPLTKKVIGQTEEFTHRSALAQLEPYTFFGMCNTDYVKSYIDVHN